MKRILVNETEEGKPNINQSFRTKWTLKERNNDLHSPHQSFTFNPPMSSIKYYYESLQKDVPDEQSKTQSSGKVKR